MRTRSTVASAIVLVLASVLALAGVACSAEVNVMISGGFSAAYGELVPAFERATGHKLVTVRGASMGTTPESIPSRLQRGESADVVIMVSEAIDALMKQGKVVDGSRVDLARSVIGMSVRAGTPKPDISSVDAFKQTLLGAKSIAYSDSASGVYLSTVLFPRLGIADQIKGKSRKIEGEPVGNVVARGEAEVGFQQVSELLAVKGVDFVGPLPAEVQKVTVFGIGVATGAKQPDAAWALMNFLASPAAIAAIKKSGLEPVASQ
jgi:molybdate transport system substrate-binding protein